MLFLKQSCYLRCSKLGAMNLSFHKCTSFRTERNSINSIIRTAPIQRLSILNNKNYYNITSNVIKTNTSCFQIDHRRYFSAESIVQTQANIFKYLSESTVVEYTQNFIIFIHDSTGLPWWASVILTTCFFRSVVTVPLALYQNYIIAKLANLSLEMKSILEELRIETAVAIKKFNWSENQTKFAFNRSAKKQWTKLIVRDNCHPVKASLLIWFQIPMWVIISTALRNIVYMMPYPDAAAHIRFLELSVGGCLWFPNLTEPDSMILPLTLGLVNLTIIEVQSLMRVKEKSRLQRYMTNFFRGFIIILVPIASTVPSCLTLYWVSSSVFGLIQNLTLMSPRIKQFVGIPKTVNDIHKPYSHLMAQIRNKFRL